MAAVQNKAGQGNEIVTPDIKPNAIRLSQRLIKKVRKKISDHHEDDLWEISISNGPLLSFGPYALHAHIGSIAEHQDGAGYTYGLVIIADGQHVLDAEGKRLPLESGSFFIINSDENHKTECDGEGLIVFLTRDFFHDKSSIALHSEAMRRNMKLEPPSIEIKRFLDEARKGLIEYL